MALEHVISSGGGIALAANGTILATVPLTVGGILSEESMDVLAEKINALQHGLISLGFDHPNPLMSLSTITLPVSPSLKITDKGLVDVNRGVLVPLFI